MLYLPDAYSVASYNSSLCLYSVFSVSAAVAVGQERQRSGLGGVCRIINQIQRAPMRPARYEGTSVMCGITQLNIAMMV